MSRADEFLDRYQKGEEEEGPPSRADELLDRYGPAHHSMQTGEPTEGSEFDVIRKLPAFQEMLVTQDMAIRSRMDPSLGPSEMYEAHADSLRGQVLSEIGNWSEEDLARFTRDELSRVHGDEYREVRASEAFEHFANAYRELVMFDLGEAQSPEEEEFLAGNREALVGRVGSLMDDVMREHAIEPIQVYDALAQEWGEGLQEFRAREDRLPGEGAMNMLMTGLGAVEFLAFPGDFVRTFIATLADVQGERVGREQGLSGARDMSMDEAVDPRVGTFTGQPAATADQALGELIHAGGRTLEHLMGDGGWIAYLPSFVLAGERRWGVSPYEVGVRVDGRQFNERFGIAERLGVEEEVGKEWLGLGTEILLDPWLWADFVWAGARLARAGSKLAPGRTQVHAPLERTADRLEEAARHAYQTLSPRGLGKAAIDVATSVPELAFPGFSERMLGLFHKSMQRMMDIPIPGGQVFHRPGTKIMGDVLGWEQLPQVTLGEAFGQSGAFAWVRDRGLQFLTGGEQHGLSAGDVARGVERRVHRIAMDGITDTHNALTTGLTENFTWRNALMRLYVPNAKRVKPEHKGYVDGLALIVSDFVDTHGLVWLGSREIPDDYLLRLTNLAASQGMDAADAATRFKNAAIATQQSVIRMGYEASGYKQFTQAMQLTADDMGLSYVELRRAYELEFAGVDIGVLEARDFFPTVRPGATGTAVTPPRGDVTGLRARFRDSPEFLAEFETGVRGHLNAMGMEGFAGLKPADYLRGIREGYLRRMFMGVEDAQASVRALQRRDLVLMHESNRADLATQLSSRYGSEIGRNVDRYLSAITPGAPRGLPKEALEASETIITMNTEDLARLISKDTGKRVTGRQIADMVLANNDDYALMQSTTDILLEYSRRPPATGAGAVPHTTPVARLQARQELTPDELAQRLQILDPRPQLASTGIVAGRSARSNTFLQEAYLGLVDHSMVLDYKDVRRMLDSGITDDGTRKAFRVMSEGAEGGAVFPFMHADGTRYVVLPRDKGWGPLANKAVPEDAARLLTYGLNYARNDYGAYGRMLAMWRRGLLAPFSTALRNIGGNFILMQQAGASFADLVQNLPRAVGIRRHFLETGVLPDEFRGYESMFGFVDESTRSRQAIRMADEQLSRIAANTYDVPTFLDWADRLTDVATSTPPLGFLPMFKWGEEVTRVSSFLSSYDALIRSGLGHEDALRRAAHFAQNAGYNYGALPLVPDLLRRTGLSGFPQFTYFTVGRTARAAMERPATLQRVEYGRQAANLAATEGDREEQESITAMMDSWERFSHPLVIPVPGGEDGSWWPIPMDFWLPQGALLQDVLVEMFGGGWLSPVVDGVLAQIDHTGLGPIGARYGQRVFDPAGTPTEKALDSAKFAARNLLLPGLFRVGGQFLDMIRYEQAPEAFDRLAAEQGRYVDSSLLQFGLRFAGFSTREIDTRGEISSTARFNELQRKYGASITSARNNERLARERSDARLARGDERGAASLMEEAERWAERVRELESEHEEEIFRLLDAIR